MSDIAELYRAHHGWLVNFLNRRVGCRENAADLTQDTFLALVGRAELLELHTPRAYLGKIASRLASNHIRRRLVERACMRAIAEQPAAYAPSAEERKQIVDMLVQIAAVFQGLPRRAQRILIMSRVDGMRYQDIADNLGVSLSTVEKDMARALVHCYLATAEEH
ncbi:MAG: sigma-70 family RNA polymerase sigma factor [Pseudomonadota bacterium]